MAKRKRFCVKVQCLHQMTGSCFLLTACYPNGKQEQFTIDCGKFNEKDTTLNDFFPFDPSKCKFSICTHAHDDHISRYPLFVKQGFNGHIYVTEGTYRLSEDVLYNASYLNTSQARYSGIEALYNENDVTIALRHFRSCPYRKIVKPTKHISFSLLENGHIVGACMIYIVISYEGEKDIRLLFTGDYHYRNMFFDVAPLPKEVTENYISMIMTESTYGNINSYEVNTKGKILKRAKEALSQGKTVIHPAFALGRAQELIYIYSEAQANGKLDDYEIFLDGLATRQFLHSFAFGGFSFNFSTRKLLPPTLRYVDRNTPRNKVMYDNNPKIVIAPGGFGNYGCVVEHIANAISRDDVLILFPGYTPPNSDGGRLKAAKTGDIVKYNGLTNKLCCEVDSSFELSRHAKKDELFKHIYYPCSQARSFLVNHGELENAESLATDIDDAFYHATTGIINSEHCYTVDASGIIDCQNVSIYQS